MKKQFFTKAIAFSIILFSANLLAKAHAPCIKKQCTLGGSGYEQYSPNIISTGGESFVTCGATGSSDGNFNVPVSRGSDAFIVKYNSIGHIAWIKTFGGSGDEMLYGIKQTSDGGYVATGWTSSNDGDVSGNHGGDHDIWVVKLNANGNIQWQKCFGGSSDEYGLTALETVDGKILIGGITNSTDGQIIGNHGDFDIWILKLNQTGGLLSKRCYGGSNYDEIDVMLQQTSGKVIFTGQSKSDDGDVIGNHGGQDAWVVKLNLAGNIVWSRTLGGSADDYGYASTITKDGNIVSGCFSFSTDGDVNGTGVLVSWYVKLNPVNGNTIWSKSSSPAERGGFGIFPTSDGGMVEAGAVGVTGLPETWDALVSKWNSNGDIEWNKTFGGSDGDLAAAGFELPNGKMILLCSSSSADGDVKNAHGDDDIWFLKIDECHDERITGYKFENNFISLSSSPNPFSNSITISFSISHAENVSIKIFDITGRLVITLVDEEMQLGIQQLEWDGINARGNPVDAGIYFFNINSSTIQETVKVQKL